jgi:hypothetical protein
VSRQTRIPGDTQCHLEVFNRFSRVFRCPLRPFLRVNTRVMVVYSILGHFGQNRYTGIHDTRVLHGVHACNFYTRFFPRFLKFKQVWTP